MSTKAQKKKKTNLLVILKREDLNCVRVSYRLKNVLHKSSTRPTRNIIAPTV